jgi:hypothetical protein
VCVCVCVCMCVCLGKEGDTVVSEKRSETHDHDKKIKTTPHANQGNADKDEFTEKREGRSGKHTHLKFFNASLVGL